MMTQSETCGDAPRRPDHVHIVTVGDHVEHDHGGLRGERGCTAGQHP